MSSSKGPRSRIVFAIPPLLIGLVVLWWAVNSKPPPTASDDVVTGVPVRIVTIQPKAFAPSIKGFGEAQPGKVWSAIAQVNGRLGALHPRLRNGQFIESGEVLYSVDPVDYELKLAEINAQLAELDVRESNTAASLEIENRNLALARKEAERAMKLADRGTSARSSADSAQRASLATEASVQNMRNTLALIPSQRAALEARQAQSQRDLANTSVKAPFTLRVAKLSAEVDQYVRVGEVLFEGDSIDRVEITAQMGMRQLRRMSLGFKPESGDAQALTRNVAQVIGHDPVVRMSAGDQIAEWKARFVRITDGLDPTTRTLGIVVAVDEPWSKTIPGVRPPLTKGMFVEVELRGKPVNDVLVIPRSAIRKGRVRTVDESSQLRTVPVQVHFAQDEWAVIGTGLAAGARVVVSDLVPAVEGMVLAPQLDDVLQSALTDASGPAQ